MGGIGKYKECSLLDALWVWWSKPLTQFFINVQHNEANAVGGGTWEVGGGSWQVGGEISSNRPERKVCNSWKEKSKACNSWTETYSVI